MKKSLKKLSLQKKAISNLTEKLNGGMRRAGNSLPTTDPTENTACFDCSVTF